MRSAGQIFGSALSGPSKHRLEMVHGEAAAHTYLTLREAVEVQLRQGRSRLQGRQRKEAAGFLLELLGLLPIQAVLVQHTQSEGETDSSAEQRTRRVGALAFCIACLQAC